jgi:hypothetical protein
MNKANSDSLQMLVMEISRSTGVEEEPGSHDASDWGSQPDIWRRRRLGSGGSEGVEESR